MQGADDRVKSLLTPHRERQRAHVANRQNRRWQRSDGCDGWWSGLSPLVRVTSAPRQKTAGRDFLRATFCPSGSSWLVAGRRETRAAGRARSTGVLAAVRCLHVIPWIRKGRRRALEPLGLGAVCWSHRQQWQKTRPVRPGAEAFLSARCTGRG